MIPTTIINGFRKTEFFPYNRDLFTEADYMASFVTDRPNSEHLNNELINPSTLPGPSSQSNKEPSLNNSENILKSTSEMETTDNKAFRSPAEFKGYPKAGPRKTTGNKEIWKKHDRHGYSRKKSD